nr:hypothetical protein [Candidatus Njordarchaeum guaymaensis]
MTSESHPTPKNFEDNFGEELVLGTLEEIYPDLRGRISIDELKEYRSSGKGIEKSIDELLRKKGVSGFKFQDVISYF